MAHTNSPILLLESLFLFILKESERHQFAVPLTCAFIGSLLHVPRLGIEPATLVCWDDPLSN